MPSRLSRADARLLWGAVAVVLLLGAGALLVGPDVAGIESPVPSSYASDSGGALAAYLLLNELGFEARRWTESPLNLPEYGEDAVVVLAVPTESPTSAEREALERFVASGGRVLFCGANLGLFFDPNTPPTFTTVWEYYRPNLPSPYSSGAARIDMNPSAQWLKVEPPQLVLYGSQDDPAVAVFPIGAGEVVWWAGTGPLTNVGIARASNLRLFLNAMSKADGSRRAVYWDEYFHGERGSLWSYIARTPVAWGIAQMGILLVAVVFTFSRRSGPMVEPAPVSRQSPLEFVDTMGGLYQRARAAPIPGEMAYRLLRVRLAQRLSMPVTAADEQLVAAAGERLGMDAAELASALEVGRMAPPDRRHALGIVQRLMRYTLQLKGQLKEIR